MINKNEKKKKCFNENFWKKFISIIIHFLSYYMFFIFITFILTFFLVNYLYKTGYNDETILINVSNKYINLYESTFFITFLLALIVFGLYIFLSLLRTYEGNSYLKNIFFNILLIFCPSILFGLFTLLICIYNKITLIELSSSNVLSLIITVIVPVFLEIIISISIHLIKLFLFFLKKEMKKIKNWVFSGSDNDTSSDRLKIIWTIFGTTLGAVWTLIYALK